MATIKELEAKRDKYKKFMNSEKYSDIAKNTFKKALAKTLADMQDSNR